MIDKKIIQEAKELCRKLRKSQTISEKLLWGTLRNRQVQNVKFFRQHPIFFKYVDGDRFYIADFYCREQNLVIEVDGKSHKYQEKYDEFRTHIINSLGVRVVRFKNQEIERHLESVLEKIHRILVS